MHPTFSLLLALSGCLTPPLPVAPTRPTPRVAGPPDQVIHRRPPPEAPMFRVEGDRFTTVAGVLAVEGSASALSVSAPRLEPVLLPGPVVPEEVRWTPGCFDAPDLCADTVVREAPGLTEAWTAEADRLWHRMRVDGPGAWPVLDLPDGEIEADGTAIRFAGGRLLYHGLRVWDDLGQDLRARFVEDVDGVGIELGAAPAKWPVWIDPWLGPADQASLDAEVLYNSFGIGDMNQDGFDDVFVSDDDYVGGFSILLGSPSGLLFDSPVQYARPLEGLALGNADINGDGLPDFLLTWLGRGNAAGPYFGTLNGGMPVPGTSYSAQSSFGPYAALGDFDADGATDVAMYVSQSETNWPNPVRVYNYYIYRGGPDYHLQVQFPAPDAFQVAYRYSGDLGNNESRGLQTNDINGDGFDDLWAHLAVTSPDPDHVEAVMYAGSPAGPGPRIAWSLTEATAGTNLLVGGLRAVGDLNGDGIDDLVMVSTDGGFFWAPGTPSGPGPIREFHREPLVCPPGLDPSMPACYPRLMVIEDVGDMNGDGYHDVAYEVQGGAGLTFGGPEGPLPARATTFPNPDSFSLTIKALGDVNGDGNDDLLLQNPPASYIWFGQPDDDPDRDGYGAPDDCHPYRSEASPGGVELPGTLYDEDCDGNLTCYVDLDGDGAGGPTTALFPYHPEGCAAAGGYPVADDCDDANVAFSPLLHDIPDNDVDEDCDGLYACNLDLDGDGYGTTTPWTDSVPPCSARAEADFDGLDCDDARADINPDGVEVAASGADEDCDGRALCGVDSDGDGYGGTVQSLLSPDETCDHPGMFAVALDCDDARADVFPGGTELIGDAVDDDCDGQLTCYPDNDEDGYGDDWPWLEAPISIGSCQRPDLSLSANRDDCIDNDPEYSPGVPEIVDGWDNNCDGWVLCAPDADSDRFGVEALAIMVHDELCSAAPWQAGTRAGNDCDDNNIRVHPLATELPGGVDENCDGQYLCSADADGDGYGGTTSTVLVVGPCTPPLGFNVPEDCNDADPAVSPNATERADGLDVDEDCDGRLACRRDADRDGWGVQAVVLHRGDTCDVPTDQVSSRTGDCDDARAAVHPAAFDAPGDGRDATCDGLDGMRLEVDATTRTLPHPRPPRRRRRRRDPHPQHRRPRPRPLPAPARRRLLRRPHPPRPRHRHRRLHRRRRLEPPGPARHPRRHHRVVRGLAAGGRDGVLHRGDGGGGAVGGAGSSRMDVWRRASRRRCHDTPRMALDGCAAVEGRRTDSARVAGRAGWREAK